MKIKTTINIDNKLIEEAAFLTGFTQKTALVEMGLKALITQESAKRLASLGGSQKLIQSIPRRR